MPDPIVASLLSVWEAVFAPALTRPAFANLFVVLSGWVLTDAPVHQSSFHLPIKWLGSEGQGTPGGVAR